MNLLPTSWLRCSLVLTAAFIISGCASTLEGSLDRAREALDTADYTTAIVEAQAALSALPGDFESTMILAIARAGRAGVNLIDLTKELTDADTSSTFSSVHSVFVSAIGTNGLTDLRTAIETLTNYTGVSTLTADELSEYKYHLGILQTIEIFSLPTITAKPQSTSTLDATDIGTEELLSVGADFIAADNNLIAGGIESSNSLITTIRQNYCALANVSAGAGFTLRELRALTTCELTADADRDALDSTDLEGAVANCAAFDFNCAAIDTL